MTRIIYGADFTLQSGHQRHAAAARVFAQAAKHAAEVAAALAEARDRAKA